MDKTVDKPRLETALKACGLHVRNWSGPDGIVLAVYSARDEYYGAVQFTNGVVTALDRWYKRDEKVLKALANAYRDAPSSRVT